MSWLQRLIIASGGVGVPGESFRNDVTGAASGARMSDYRLTAVGFSGEPAPELTYDDNDLFNVTATFTRGSRAHHIQRNVSAAWAVSIIGGPTGASATVETFTANGSPLGASHSLGIRVRAPYGGSPAISGNLTQPAALEPADPDADPWPVRLTFSVGGGGTGTTAMTLEPLYVVDAGAFNTALTDAWPMTINNRSWSTSDYECEWHGNSGFTDLLSTSATYDLTNSALYPSVPEGLFGGEEITVYLRYRLVGGSTWTEYGGTGAVFYEDPRPAV